MKWKPLCLSGSEAYIIVNQAGTEVYAFGNGDIFVTGHLTAVQFANRAVRSNPIGDGMAWHYRGDPDNLTLYLRDKHGRIIGMVHMLKSANAAVVIRHHDESAEFDRDTLLDKRGTYSGMDLIGRLRELTDGLTGARALV